MINISIEPELETKVTELFAEIGLDINTATDMFYRKALLCNGLPFEPAAEIPNETTLSAISAAENGELYGPFDNIDELMEALNA